MYALASKLINLPILSLQNAEALAQVKELIINPTTFAVAAFACVPNHRDEPRPVVMPRDVRQVALDCLLVDNAEAIGDASDVVRLIPLIDEPYRLVGKRVVTEMHRSLGRVEDYVINLDNFEVQKLEVRPGLLQSWIGSALMIDRGQVIEVGNREIVVREAVTQEPLKETWLGHKPATKP